MTEPDIIRIDGVEYEECQDCHGDRCADPRYICIRPKRKQTGWICTSGRCDAKCVILWRTKPVGSACVWSPCNRSAVWSPFYGKVVE